jgi:DNA replication protein DnaC
MTNTQQPVADWLADFKNRHSIDLSFVDGDVAADRAALAAEYAAAHIPARFADALPTVPEVEQWTADVVRGAMDESSRRGRLVSTIHTGPSLLLLGSTGVGKTFVAYGAMRVISLLGIHARWQVVSAADLYALLRPRHGVDTEEEFRSIADAPLLVVDDLGAAKTSEWVEEVNFRLVNSRYEQARPSLFTSNVPPRDLAAALGERVASRLAEMTTQVAIKGQDRRRGRAA